MRALDESFPRMSDSSNRDVANPAVYQSEAAGTARVCGGGGPGVGPKFGGLERRAPTKFRGAAGQEFLGILRGFSEPQLCL